MNISSVEKIYMGSDWTGTYKVTLNDNSIIYVPHNTDNTDYQAIQDWVAAGNSVVDPNAE